MTKQNYYEHNHNDRYQIKSKQNHFSVACKKLLLTMVDS